MMQLSTEGIVIRQVGISGGKKMITIFTREMGKISCSTLNNDNRKGKNGLLTNPFTMGKYNIYKGRGYYSLNGGEVINSHYGLSENLDRYMCASYALELTDKILEDEKREQAIFNLLVDFLVTIEKKSKDFDTVLIAYMLRLLKALGSFPMMDMCTNCGSKEDLNYFSVCTGGMICENCYKEIKGKYGERLIYDGKFGIVNLTRYFMGNPIEKFQKLSLRSEKALALRQIIKEYYAYHLGIENLKSEAVYFGNL